MTGKDNAISTSADSVTKEFAGSISDAVRYRLGYQDCPVEKTILKAGQRIHRVSYKSLDHKMEILKDDYGNDAVCEFVRLGARNKNSFLFILPDVYDMFMKQETGWLFRSRYPGKQHYWLPVQPAARSYDKFGRIVSEEFLQGTELTSLGNESYAVFEIPEEKDCIEFVVWTLTWESPVFEELHSLSSIERQRIFVWGSDTPYAGPKDLYKYVIYGAVYKPRMPWPAVPWSRAYCEVVAYALYIIFHSLWKATGKKIYHYMKTQLVFSVAARQKSDGAWRHGLWTHDFEVHYRHHCSGIHMLSADYEETQDAVVDSVLQKAISFLNIQCEELRCGTWYLHDSLERSAAGMKNSPLPFMKSRTLGKSTSNMLVLNTHLDALVALRRYEEVSGRPDQGKNLTSGTHAVITVLGLKPAELLYRILLKAIELTFMPISKVKSLSLKTRALRKLAKIAFIPLMPRVKKFLPRLVMPNGYIDRDLSVNYLNHDYLAINVWDLLRFQKRFEIEMVDAVIDRAIDFALRSGLVERWLEEKNYMLGFWAEAMYLECLRRPEKNRTVLADAVIALSDSERGMPPGLLGCNHEFVPLESQVPCIILENDRIVTVNLSTGTGQLEFLLINATSYPQETEIPQSADKWVVRNRRDDIISAEGKMIVPPRDWMILKSI